MSNMLKYEMMGILEIYECIFRNFDLYFIYPFHFVKLCFV